MSKFGDKLKNKALTKVGLKGATKVAGKVGSKVGSRFIPVLGQGLLMVDGIRAPQKQLKKRAKTKSFAGRKI